MHAHTWNNLHHKLARSLTFQHPGSETTISDPLLNLTNRLSGATERRCQEFWKSDTNIRCTIYFARNPSTGCRNNKQQSGHTHMQTHITVIVITVITSKFI